MDYIREFDIRLEKEMYYAGEILSGHVILDTVENFKLKGRYYSYSGMGGGRHVERLIINGFLDILLVVQACCHSCY